MKKLYFILHLFLKLLLINEIVNLKLKNETDFEKMVEDFKQSVVMIDIESDFQLFGESSTNAQATGFVIDKELRLIATNKHVTRISPTRHKIKFYDGSILRGTVVYYDFYHDFGFIQLDLMKDSSAYNDNDLREKLKPVKLGSSYDVKIGEELFLIGNNEGVNYSIKYGSVIDLNVPDSRGFGSMIQTSFDRTGGSSGSPVWNKIGNVVALHAMGDKSNSFEVPIDYVKAALHRINSNISSNKVETKRYRFDKGFIGINLNLIPMYKLEHNVDSASKLNNINNTDITQIIETTKKSQRIPNSVPQVIQVSYIIKNSPSDDIIKSGDIILKLNDKIIGNDLILYEKIIDENVNKNVSLTVYRFGSLLKLENIPIQSTENGKITKFIKLSNTILLPITLYMKTFYPLIPLSGLYVSQVGLSSPFQEISSEGNFIIASLNSKNLLNLEDLIKALESICDRTNIYIEAMDLNISRPRYMSYSIDFGDLNELYIYEMDTSLGGWKSEIVKLNQCLNNSNIKSRRNENNLEEKFYYSTKKLIEYRNRFLKINLP